jgi:hypothetical protein
VQKKEAQNGPLRKFISSVIFLPDSRSQLPRNDLRLPPLNFHTVLLSHAQKRINCVWKIRVANLLACLWMQCICCHIEMKVLKLEIQLRVCHLSHEHQMKILSLWCVKKFFQRQKKQEKTIFFKFSQWEIFENFILEIYFSGHLGLGSIPGWSQVEVCFILKKI